MMKRPPRIRLHKVKPSKLEVVNPLHVARSPYVYGQYGGITEVPAIESKSEPAYEATILISELQELEEYCRDWDEEEKIRRSDPRLYKLWHEYHLMLNLLR